MVQGERDWVCVCFRVSGAGEVLAVGPLVLGGAAGFPFLEGLFFADWGMGVDVSGGGVVGL